MSPEPAAPDALAEHYLILDGRRQGPFTLDELRLLWGQGRIDGKTPWWRLGMPDWALLAGLRAELQLEPEPGPPPPDAGGARGRAASAGLVGLRRVEATDGAAAPPAPGGDEDEPGTAGTEPAERVRVVMLVLWWMFGWLGVHYLYAGRLRSFGRHWLCLGLAAVGWALGAFGGRDLAYLGQLVLLIGGALVLGRLAFDLGLILVGGFRDGEGVGIRRWT